MISPIPVLSSSKFLEPPRKKDYINLFNPVLKTKLLVKRRNNLSSNLCRVVGAVDADCFEVQIYQQYPQYQHTKGFPTVLALETGRIVSRSHEAKDLGISRNLKVHQAKQICPDLHVIYGKKKFGKHDTTEKDAISDKIREAALSFREDLIDSTYLDEVDIPIHRTGCDEFLIDLTQLVTLLIDHDYPLQIDATHRIFMEGRRSTYNGDGLTNRNVYYYSIRHHKYYEEVRLAYGLQIVDKLCQHILKETKIVCSGGVGSNKVLSKLACSIHKPNAITALTRRGFYRISYRIPFRDVSGFGNMLGLQLHTLFGNLSVHKMWKCWIKNFNNVKSYVGIERAEKAGRLLFGICHDPITPKLMNVGLNCGKGNLDIRSESEFKAELNHRVQNMLAKMQLDNTANKRNHTELKIQYRYDRCRTRSFPIDLNAVAFAPDQKGVF